MDSSTARWLSPPPLQRPSLRWLAASIFALISLAVWALMSRLHTTETVIALSIFGCAGLYAIAAMLTARFPSERYSVLRSIPVFAVFLSGGAFPAVITAYLGALLFNLVHTAFSPHFRLDRFTITRTLLNVLYDGGMSSTAALLGGLGYTLAGGTIPLAQLDDHSILGILIFTAVSFVALYVPWHLAEPAERRVSAIFMRRVIQAQAGYPLALIHAIGYTAGTWSLPVWLVVDGLMLLATYLFGRLDMLRMIESDSIRILQRERATERALATRITLPDPVNKFTPSSMRQSCRRGLCLPPFPPRQLSLHRQRWQGQRQHP
ncbi:MAG: hypothetical protein U0528_16890 [Anaerolineae bacterium]